MVSREGLQFCSDKARVLEQVDLSRKGSVDDAIVPMVELLNSMEEYYTTSSCSGRISVFSEVILVTVLSSPVPTGYETKSITPAFIMPCVVNTAGQQAAEEGMSLVAHLT